MPQARLRRQRASLLTLLVLCAASTSAVAQSCRDQINRLARQYDLSTEAPRSGSTETPAAPSAPPSAPGPTTTEGRAQSGGVLAPPDTAAPTAIRPPRSSEHQASTPDMGAATPGESGQLAAAERNRMAAQLQAAQAAARDGNEQQCLEHLREAQAIPGVPGTR